MGPALFLLTSLRTVAKQNQLLRFRMASTAATVNSVRSPLDSLGYGFLDPDMASAK